MRGGLVTLVELAVYMTPGTGADLCLHSVTQSGCQPPSVLITIAVALRDKTEWQDSVSGHVGR